MGHAAHTVRFWIFDRDGNGLYPGGEDAEHITRMPDPIRMVFNKCLEHNKKAAACVGLREYSAAHTQLPGGEAIIVYESCQERLHKTHSGKLNTTDHHWFMPEATGV